MKCNEGWYVCLWVVLLTGAWHLVELIAAGKNMTMRVDGGAARTIINDGEHQFMELEEPLYLGGLPASVRDSAKKKYHVRNTDSFNGKTSSSSSSSSLCLFNGGTTGSASDQRSEGCGFEAY